MMFARKQSESTLRLLDPRILVGGIWACLLLTVPSTNAGSAPDNGATLLETARVAPPGISTELILRVLEADSGIYSMEERQNALEEVLAGASTMRRPSPEVYVGIRRSHSPSRLLENFISGEMTDLSVRARALAVLANFDVAQARQRALSWIPLEYGLPIPNCDHPSISVRDPLYDALGVVAKVSSKREDSEHKEFIRDLLFGLVSAAGRSTELAAVGRLLIEVEVTSRDFRDILVHYTRLLTIINDGDPLFTYAMDNAELVSVVANIARRARTVHGDATALVDAFRKFIVRQSGKPRCAFSIEVHESLRFDQTKWDLRFNFEKGSGRPFESDAIPPLEREDLEPKVVIPYEPEPGPMLSETGTSLLRELDTIESALHAADRSGPLSSNLRQQVAHALERARSWRPPSDYSARRIFAERCLVLHAALIATQRTSVEVLAARQAIDHLENSTIVSEDPALWMGCFDRLADLSFSEWDKSERGSVPPFVAAARSSRDPSLFAAATIADGK